MNQMTALICFLGLWVSPIFANEFNVQKEIVYPQFDSADQPTPRFGFGYLASFSKSRTMLRLYDSAGYLLYHNDLLDSNGVQLKVVDVAISPNGRVAMSASAIRSDGQSEAVLAFLDRQGKLTHLVKQKAFVSTRIRFLSEDELWTLGFSRATSPSGLASGSAIRVYDGFGKHIKDLMPISDFTGIRHPTLDGMLLSASTGMAVYLPTLQTLYVYTSTADPPAKYIDLPVPAYLDVLTACLIENTKLFIQALAPTESDSKKFSVQIFTIRLADSKRKLVPIETDAKKALAIIGVTGRKLVHFRASRVFVGEYVD